MWWIVLKFLKQKAAGCIELKGLFTFLLGFIWRPKYAVGFDYFLWRELPAEPQ